MCTLRKPVWISNKIVETSIEDRVSKQYNKEVRNDRTIPNNKPEKIIRENEKYILHYWGKAAYSRSMLKEYNSIQ